MEGGWDGRCCSVGKNAGDYVCELGGKLRTVGSTSRRHGACVFSFVGGGVVRIRFSPEHAGKSEGKEGPVVMLLDVVEGGMEMYIAEEFGFGETGFELDWRGRRRPPLLVRGRGGVFVIRELLEWLHQRWVW